VFVVANTSEVWFYKLFSSPFELRKLDTVGTPLTNVTFTQSVLMEKEFN